MRAQKTLYLLTGPTAAGKTGRAIDWALAHDAEILSCDALLFYRGMDVGTAKPTAEERARVPHHGIDLCPVDAPCDVGAYSAYARNAVADIAGRGRNVLVCGGSGFYLKSFFAPVVDAVEVPDAVRAAVAELERTHGLAGLLERLHRLNPEGLGELDANNPRRVARALERCLASGKSVLELRADFEALPAPFPDWEKRIAVIDRDPGDLRARVVARADAMIAGGLVEEVRGLLAAGIERNPTAASAIGYRETIAHLREGGGLEDLAAAIARNTMRLVKKQRTWFRTQLPEHRRLVLGADNGVDAQDMF